MTYVCNLTEPLDLGILKRRGKAIGVQPNDSDPVAQLGALCKTKHHFGTRQSRTSHSAYQKGNLSMDESMDMPSCTSRIQLQWMKKPVFNTASYSIGKYRSIP